MSVAATREQLSETPDPYGAYPRLSPEQITALEAHGTRRATNEGEIIFRAGDTSYDFVVVLQGMVGIVERDHGAERLIAVHGAGRFLGELNLLTGETAFVSAVVRQPGEVLAVPAKRLRELVATDPTFGDLILRAFIIRRSILIGLRTGLRIVGSRHSPDTRRLREFAARNRLPHSWIDLEDYPAAETLLRELGVAPAETPVVICSGETVLRNPTNAELARVVGLPVASASEAACDVVIVGLGPAGLAAAVYAASEGLGTIAVDAVAAGGQAATSSRIENYLGFPFGISGAELAERAAIQADKFGARPRLALRATSLTRRDGNYVMRLDDGGEIESQGVVIATGARYRTLDIPRLAQFEGTSVYYAATEIEAQSCRMDPVAIVGGGNSAGQAAVFLSGHAPTVHLLLRGGDLGADMSRYLVDRIAATSNIHVHPLTELTALLANQRGELEKVRWKNQRTGVETEANVRHVFLFVGADPATEWLRSCEIVLDGKGFVKTGADLTRQDLVRARRRDVPRPLETSVPGVFAIGDVRCGSVKRVGGAIGEGAAVVAQLHSYLAELDEQSVDRSSTTPEALP